MSRFRIWARTGDRVPQIPDGQSSAAGRDVALGSGWVDVFATGTGATPTTRWPHRPSTPRCWSSRRRDSLSSAR